jgi:hypothetical protein
MSIRLANHIPHRDGKEARGKTQTCFLSRIQRVALLPENTLQNSRNGRYSREQSDPTAVNNQFEWLPSSPIRRVARLRRATLHLCGVVVLFLGLGIAAFVYGNAQLRAVARPSSNANADWQDSTLSTEDSKKSSRDVEMYYGNVGLLIVKWRDWFARPESQALIIASVSTLTALGCFVFANRSRKY